MKTIRKSPFLNSNFSFLMAFAGFLGMASFINLKDNDTEKEINKNSILTDLFLTNYLKKVRFGFIILLFIILTLEEDL
jgi:hypothetical protein